MRRTWVALLAIALALAAPSSALALAGGSTGSGGGGGSSGGGSSSGSSSFSSPSSSSGSSGSSTGTGGGGWVAGVIVLAVFGLFFAAMVVGVVLIARHAAATGGRGGGGAYAGRLIGNPLQRRARARQVETAAQHADVGDGYWDPAELKGRIAECFYPIQWSWEKRDVESSRPFVSDALYERHKLQLDGLEKQNRVNRIQDLSLHNVELVRIHNVTDDGEDRFVARIKCSARDWMEDTKTGALINGSKSVSQFEQYWSFSRHPEHGWVLDEIQQGTEGEYHLGKIVNDDQGEPNYGDTQSPVPSA
jgi:hypothetical protein